MARGVVVGLFGTAVSCPRITAWTLVGDLAPVAAAGWEELLAGSGAWGADLLEACV